MRENDWFAVPPHPSSTIKVTPDTVMSIVGHPEKIIVSLSK